MAERSARHAPPVTRAEEVFSPEAINDVGGKVTAAERHAHLSGGRSHAACMIFLLGTAEPVAPAILAGMYRTRMPGHG
jgi:hypothetical protein